MKRLMIGFVAIVVFLAFFSSALAIDRAPKKSNEKKNEEPVELKEGKKSDLKEGKVKGILSAEKKNQEIKREGEEKTKGTFPDEKITRWRKSSEKPKAKEKYDYFIDKNNNGIDDRLERKNPKKSISTPAVRPVQKEKQPAKSAPSVKETDKTEKIKEAPKKKEVKKVEKTEGEKRR